MPPPSPYLSQRAYIPIVPCVRCCARPERQSGPAATPWLNSVALSPNQTGQLGPFSRSVFQYESILAHRPGGPSRPQGFLPPRVAVRLGQQAHDLFMRRQALAESRLDCRGVGGAFARLRFSSVFPEFPEYSFPSWDLDTCRQGLKGWAMDRVERLFVALAVIGFLIVSVIWILLS
jgi:hypothetical protein